MRYASLFVAVFMLPTMVLAVTDGTIAMSGRDFGKVSRVQIDGLPKEGYVLEPGNRGLELRFNKMPGKLSADDLPPGGAATRVKNAEVTEDGDTTVLKLNYNCDCQAEVYEWQRKKLVIDIFSNEAVRNPDKIKDIAKSNLTDDKKIKAKELGKDTKEGKAEAKEAVTTPEGAATQEAAATEGESTSTANAPQGGGETAANNQQAADNAAPNDAAPQQQANARPAASQQENSSAGAEGEQAAGAQQRSVTPDQKGSVAATTDSKAVADQKLRDGLRQALSAAQAGGVIRFKSTPAATGSDSGTSAMGGGSLAGNSNSNGGAVYNKDVATGQASNSDAQASATAGGANNGESIGGGGALSGNQSQGRSGSGSAAAALPPVVGQTANASNTSTLKPTPYNSNPAQALSAVGGKLSGTGDAAHGGTSPLNNASTPRVNMLNGNVQTIIPGAPTGNTPAGNGSTCLPDSAFAFNLAPEKTNDNTARADFYDKLTEYKGNLISEFDRTDPEAALQLAQYYTAYGFGDEAMGILSSFSVPEQRGRTVQSLAELFTDVPPSKKSILNVGAQCGGVHRLWSAYWALKSGDSNAAAAIAQDINPESDVAALPKSLRIAIGGDLALNLARHRQFDQAEKIIDIVAESKDQHDPKVLLVRGMVEGARGNAHKIIDKLNLLVNSTVDNNPEARLALAELKLSQQYPLSEDDLSSLEEIAYLHSRRKEGAAATALIAENSGQKKDIYGAFTHLSHNRYSKQETDNPVMQQARTMFAAMADKGYATDDPKNMLVYWDYPQLIPQEPPLLKSFAQRLTSLGYDKAASQVLEDTRKAFPQNAVQNGLVQLESQSLLRRQQADDALSLLQQYPKDASVPMRLNAAQAYIKKGEPQQAVAQLAGLTQPDAVKLRAQAAWLSRDWATAAQDYGNAQVFANDSAAKMRAESAQYMQTGGIAANAPLPTPDAAVNEAAKTIEMVKKALRHG